jgi:hypothetical protein
MDSTAGYAADVRTEALGYVQLQTLTRNILDNFRAGALALIGFSDDGHLGVSWRTTWGCSPVLQAWPTGSRHVAVGRFTAISGGRSELALLRDTGPVGPRLAIFEFGESGGLTANVWIAYGDSALLDG